MYLVGLTGGIGSGKSTVASRFVQHGVELVDADEIARVVVEPGKPAYRKIVEHFGTEVLDEEGFIDRPRLGAVVFADESKRALLNELTHPRVAEQIAGRLELLQAFDGVVILDVPLLVEAREARSYEAIVVVASKPDTQLRRLVELRGMPAAQAQARIDAQAPLEEKLAVATHVIWNEGSLDELYSAVDGVAEDLLRRAREKASAEEEGIPND
ncbi:MAG: dephospho-CoA kinase [Nitriliruptorales bacterium]|nr:dephospho-CoA kinase [Nitriliruptorales bacterium]